MNTSPFVGRTRELNALNNALAKTLAGQPSLMFITGEAGIGKSRLLREFIEQARTTAPEVVVATGECNSHYGQADPLLPFRAISAQLFEEDPDKLRPADRQTLADKAKDVILEIAPDAIGVFIPLAGLGLKLLQALNKLRRSTHKSPQDDDRFARVALFEQYCRLLFWATKEAPLLLILEDLHWADTTTVDFLFYLVRSLRGQRLLVVGTYRPQDLSADGHEHPLLQVLRDLTRYGLCQQIAMDWLCEQELQEWIALKYPINRFTTDFVQWLHQRTEGNALFVDETIKHLEESGAIFLAGDATWELSESLNGADDLPDSIVSVLEQRLAQLEIRLHEELTCASVEGEEFTAQVIAGVRHLQEDDVVNELENVLARQLKLVALKEERQSAHHKWLTVFEFRHTLMQKHLYGTLQASSRRRLHQKVGECLEQLYEGAVDQIAPALVRHFVESGDTLRAYQYGLKAAEHAEKAYDHQATKLWLEVVTDRLEVTPLDLPGQASLWHRLGRAQFCTGDFRKAEHSYQKALECCERGHDRGMSTRILADLAYVYSNIDRSRDALALLQKAVSDSQELGLRRDAAYAMLRLAIVYQKLARHDLYYEHLVRAREEFEVIGDPEGQAEVNRNLGIYYKIVGDLSRSTECLTKAIGFHHRLGDKHGEAADYTNLGSTYLALENNDTQALACYQRSLDLSYEGSAMHEQAHVLLNIGRVFGLRREWPQALHYVEKGIRLAELVRETYDVIRGLWYLGIVHFHLGNVTGALTDYQEAIDLEIHDPWLHWAVLYNLGSVKMELGQSESGLMSYHESCNLLLNIAAEMPDHEQTTFLETQNKVNVFLALMFWGGKMQRMDLIHRTLERLPRAISLNPVQLPPRFYWGGGRWI